MRTLGIQIKRNTKLFFKDKGLFFTSLITPLILLVLYAAFLANVYEKSFIMTLSQGGTIDISHIDEGIIKGCVGGQLISSILAVSCITVAFCSNMLMVQDKISGAGRDYAITPVKSATLSLAYYISTIISTLIICLSATAFCLVYIAVIGFYFLCLGPDFSLEISDLLVLMCAIVFAFHIITVDHFSPKCDGVRLSLVQFVVAFILNTIIALIFESPIDVSKIEAGFLPLLYLGIMSSGVGYTFQILGQKNADPTVSSVLLSLESVFGVIGAAIILEEQMTEREYIGCAIVFVAILISQVDFIDLIKQAKSKQKEN